MAITKKANITNVLVRELDFVSAFGEDWRSLMNIFDISRPIAKVPGQGIQIITASVSSLETSPAEGVDITPSTVTITGSQIVDPTIEKYATAITIEAIDKYGYETAIERSDRAFKNKLQTAVKGKFYTFLNTGSLTSTETTFQAALAGAKGAVLNKWSTLGLDPGEVVAFVNVTDFYSYLGTASVTLQTSFGMTYIADFMGYSRIFLCDNNEVASGTVLATPVANIVAYYVNPADSAFAQSGLEFTVEGETPILGYHVQPNYTNMTSEAYALMGLYLLAEHLDGIANVTITP